MVVLAEPFRRDMDYAAHLLHEGSRSSRIGEKAGITCRQVVGTSRRTSAETRTAATLRFCGSSDGTWTKKPV